ncbi:MAG: hypothetical protein JW880_07535 [Candidatus Thermoplasmatota archaeon]|nr:hypothetical protein [Candidatus Thermoplasmatota archaeon]
MTTRTNARRQILGNAQEGREHVRPKPQVKRIGPRRWIGTEYGYTYWETIRNWEPSTAQMFGLVTMLVGLAVILFIALYFASSG